MDKKEAIEILQKDIDEPGSVDIQDVNEAEKLAIKSMRKQLTESNQSKEC